MSRRWRRGLAGLVVVALAALVVAASAFAYWTAAGGGGGPATVSNAQAVTLTVGTPSAQLYPGGQADVAVDVSNPNSIPVHLGSLSLDGAGGTGGFDVDAGHSGCDPAVLSFTTQTNAGAGWTVPPKVAATNGLLALDLSGALAMSTAAAGACQGASLHLHLSVGP